MRYAYIYPGARSGNSNSKMVWILKSDKEIDVYANNEKAQEYWQEYFAEETTLNPIATFNDLHAISEPPFACYYRYEDCHLMSASPERFLKKIGRKLISQPIKGTRKRGGSIAEDNQLKKELVNCPKERSENVMIVDLVRNDLSRTASKGSVKVGELFGIYLGLVWLALK